VTDISPDAVRRYLLGAATEEEAAAIEIEYLRREPVLDRVAVIEEELIEDFLAGALPPADRDRFERVYLASAAHRRRVDIIRRLNSASASGAAAAPSARAGATWRVALALAATVVLAVSGFWWMRTVAGRRDSVDQRGRPPTSAARPGPQPAGDGARPAPRIFALTLSPLATRSAGDARRIVIPADVDTVAVDLETDSGTAGPPPTRAALRTVGGDPIWEGAAGAPPAGAASGVAARIEVPASLLRPDDYVITLLVAGPTGNVTERARYVLRIGNR